MLSFYGEIGSITEGLELAEFYFGELDISFVILIMSYFYESFGLINTFW